MFNHWRLKDFDVGGGLAAGAERGAGEAWSDGAIDIPAPGDAYLALVEAGRLAHPFEARNEADAAWVRDREWWQAVSFDPGPPPEPGERVRLVFEGLDTFAVIYLDGALLGRTDNMFRTYVFDITDRLGADGDHTLAICFSPPSVMMAGRESLAWAAFTDRVSASKRN